jgi:hypothetical protein
MTFGRLAKLQSIKCALFNHNWKMSPGRSRRACRRCFRREVLYSRCYSFRGGRLHEEWIEHKYPIDADPSKDPTVVMIDGYCQKLGDLYNFSKIMKN